MKKLFFLFAMIFLPHGASAQSLDIYGGRTDISCTNATGVFKMVKKINRWWYCTPAGHVYISMNFNVQFVQSPTPTNNTAYLGPSVRVTAASQSGSNTTYTYSATTNCSGGVLTGTIPAASGNIVTISGMADAGNNVTAITISSTGAGTFTIPNASGVAHAGQTGCANYFQNGYLRYAVKYATGTDTLGVGSNREWQMLKRATSWGLNSIGIDSQQGYAWETCTGGLGCIWPGGTNPIPLPAVVTFKPTLYASVNQQGYQTWPIKDGAYAMTAAWASSVGGEFYDIFDPQESVEISAEFTNALNTSALYQAVNNSPWVLGVSADDSDWFEGTGSAGDFQQVGIQPNYGLITMVTSPRQTMNPSTKFISKPYVYPDTLNYTKAQALSPGACSIAAPCSLRDYLWKKYSGSISALNTAWGSSYTTFDSSGTTVASESFGTGDGVTVTFTHTLAHTPVSPFTVAVSVASTVMSGDQPWFKYSGTVNTGTILGVPTTVKISAASQSGSNTTYTYTMPGNGNVVYPSEPVTVTGMADAVNNGSFVVASVAAGTFTVVNAPGVTHASQNGTGVIAQSLTSSTINYSTGAVSLTFTTAPANAAAITVSYIYGGWQAGGTGLMDESGSGAWVGTNAFCIEGANPSYPTYFACTGAGGAQYKPVPDANATFGADIDGWLPQYMAFYHKTMQADLRATGSLVPFLGLDNFGTGGPPFGGVMAGAAPYVDALQVQALWWMPTATFNPPGTPSISPEFPSMYQYVTQYAGDVPLQNYIPVAATLDSDEAFNIGNALGGSIDEMPTQSARALMYYNTINYLLNTPSYSGDYQYVAFLEWAWQDFQNENWGLVSLLDNAYDGVEAVSATVACEAGYTVNGGAMCGGDTANYGNVITGAQGVKTADHLWLDISTNQIPATTITSGDKVTSGVSIK